MTCSCAPRGARLDPRARAITRSGKDRPKNQVERMNNSHACTCACMIGEPVPVFDEKESVKWTGMCNRTRRSECTKFTVPNFVVEIRSIWELRRKWEGGKPCAFRKDGSGRVGSGRVAIKLLTSTTFWPPVGLDPLRGRLAPFTTRSLQGTIFSMFDSGRFAIESFV